jgi:hypothetical protein
VFPAQLPDVVRPYDTAIQRQSQEHTGKPPGSFEKSKSALM